MTADAPRPDLDEAERPDMLLIDVLSRYRRRVDVHKDDDLVIRRTTRLPAFFREELARRRLAVVPIAEYDRRGAALADAQAEIARLREAVDAVRELVDTPQAAPLARLNLIRRALAAAPAPDEAERLTMAFRRDHGVDPIEVLDDVHRGGELLEREAWQVVRAALRDRRDDQ